MSVQEVGVRLKLETGEFVPNANQATQAVDSLVNALQKAAIAGNSKGVLDYARSLIAYNKATGVEEERNDKGQQPTALRIVENATKVISRAPAYIGAIGSGNAAGATLGMASDVAAGAKAGGLFAGLGTSATVGLGVGAAIVGVGLAANKLSEQWEKQVPQAMELTAVLGNLTGNYRTNSEAFRKAFNLAGEAATQFGYSAEEGMAAMEQLAKIGVSSRGLAPYNAAQQVFRFERGTGADRESLMRAEGYAERYGAGPNALGYTLGGAKMQGLENAQYQEYLNATLSIFEEGLSRGIIKGFDEITRTQNFIAMLGNGNPVWKGEQGLRRYQTMNEGFKSTSFESEYDVIRYQAVRATLQEAAKHNYKDETATGGSDWSIYEKYGDPNDYLAVQRAREHGLTPEIFGETMKILQTKVAGGSYSDLTEAVIKIFEGINYTLAPDIINSFNEGLYKHAVSVIAEPTSATSPEMTLKTATEQIKIALANAGTNVLPAKTEVMSILRGILMGITGDKMAEGYQKKILTALGGIYGSKSEEMVKGKAETLLTKGLNDKTGKDTDQNGISDNSEAAMNIISYLENLPDDVRRYLSASGTLDSLWTGKNVNDLPGIADFLAKNQYKTKDWEKGFNAFTGKTPPSLNEISSLFDKFGQYNPKWTSEYPKIGIFKGAAVDNDPGAGGLFREISLRTKTLESSWDEKIAKATKDAKADGSVTKKEQSYIDQLEAGKKKELSALIDSILGPLNTLIDSAGRNGGGITQDEWEKMWKMIAPGVQGGNPSISQSDYEPSGTGPAEVAMAKLPASLSLAGSSFADMLTGKFRGWAPRVETAALTPSFDSAGRNGGGITQDEWEKMWKMIAPGVQGGNPSISQSDYEPSGTGPAEVAMAKLPASLSLAGSSFADMLTGKFRGWAPRVETAALTPSFDSAGRNGGGITQDEWEKMWKMIAPGVQGGNPSISQSDYEPSGTGPAEVAMAKLPASLSLAGSSFADMLTGKFRGWAPRVETAALTPSFDSAGRNGGGITQDEWEKMWKMIAPGVQGGNPSISQSDYEPSGTGPAEVAMAKLPASLSLAGSSFADMLTGKFRGWAPRVETAALTPSFDSAGRNGGGVARTALLADKFEGWKPRIETSGFVQPAGNGENNGEQATIPDKPQIDYRRFSALFMSAQQKSLSNNEVAQSSVDWHDFFLSFARILNDFTVNNNAAAEKIAKAADKIAEPTEVIIGPGNAFERA